MTTNLYNIKIGSDWVDCPDVWKNMVVELQLKIPDWASNPDESYTYNLINEFLLENYDAYLDSVSPQVTAMIFTDQLKMTLFILRYSS